MNQKIQNIEVLRAVAVLFVVVHHMKDNLIAVNGGWVGQFYQIFNGWVGVDLFFAISGFVIMKSLLPRLPEPKNTSEFWREIIAFWIRRAWRLLPSAWFWLLSMLLLSVVFNRSGVFGSVETNIGATIAGFLNIANFRFADAFGSYTYGASFVYWSLSLEEQFYLVLPFLIFFLGRWLPHFLLLVVFFQLLSERNLLLMVLRTDALILGALIGIWSQTVSYRLFEPTFLKNKVFSFSIVLALLTSVALVPSSILNIAQLDVSMVAILSAALVLIASYGQEYAIAPSILNRSLSWLGSRSYAIYLTHIPVFFVLKESMFRFDWVIGPYLMVMLALGIIVLLSDINYRLLEKPLRDLGSRKAQMFSNKKLPELVNKKPNEYG